MSKKKKKKSGGRILSTIILIIALCGLGYSGYHLAKYAWQTWQTNKTRDQVAGLISGQDETAIEDSDEAMRKAMMKKYGKLYKQNKDFIGWLKVENTGIDNPVMFTPDDGLNGQFYLRKNFYKNYDIAGTMFVDYRNVLDPAKGVSTNTIIYGHRMKNDTMFGPLKHYKDSAYAKEHDDIQFDTLYRPGRYKMFAVILSEAKTVVSEDEFVYYDFIDADSEKEFDKDIASIKAESIYYDDKNAPSYGDELLTLSTCDYYKENGRLALIAKRVD